MKKGDHPTPHLDTNLKVKRNNAFIVILYFRWSSIMSITRTTHECLKLFLACSWTEIFTSGLLYCNLFFLVTPEVTFVQCFL